VNKVRQKDIWYADLNPVKGSEQAGIRPVLVVSGNLLNDHLNVVWIVPLTTKIKKYKGNPIINPDTSNGLDVTSEAIVFHLRSISKERLIRKVGEISEEAMLLAKKTINDIIEL